MKWKDATRNGTVVESNARAGMFRLSVHHYVGCGETWFMSCYLVFSMTELGEMSLSQAKVMATAKLQAKLAKALSAITEE